MAGTPVPGVQVPEVPVQAVPLTRRGLVLETWFVELAFLFPGIVAAIDVFAVHVAGTSKSSPFATVVPGRPVENFILGMLSYLGVGAMVPVALLLLARTGQPPAALGLGRPRWSSDLWPGLGLAVAAFGSEVVLAIPFAPLVAHHNVLFNQLPVGHVPTYYVFYGIAVAAVTSITEETLVNGYLLTRLEQFGWTPRRALILSLCLRSSYHIYYGLGFLFTIPFGYYVTRSYQKNRRLTRPIVAHFLYDATLFTVSVLASGVK